MTFSICKRCVDGRAVEDGKAESMARGREMDGKEESVVRERRMGWAVASTCSRDIA